MSDTRARRPTIRLARFSPLALALLLLTLLGGCAVSGKRLLIDDASSRLERTAVETAATPLLARGADVALIIVERGDDSGADFRRRLDTLGLLEGGQIAEQGLALYVSFEPRYSELSAGGNWSRKLPNATLREIRLATLNPALRNDQLTQGVADTLAALEARLGRVTLGDRIATAWGWLGIATITVLVVWFISLTLLGEKIAWLWRRSPPGRLAEWLWDQTPRGKRRLQRLITRQQQLVADRAEYARSWCQGLSSRTASTESKALGDQLRQLDQQRKRLQQLPLGRKLLDGLEQLASDYTYLGHAASRLAPPPAARKKARSGQQSLATGAATTAESSWTSDSSSASSSNSSDWYNDSSSGSSSPSSDGGSW